MTTTTYDPTAPESDLRRRGIRLGDILFKGIAIAAAVGAAALLGLIAYKVFDLAWPAVQTFGLSFVWTEAWDPVTEQFGALIFIYGTVVTSVIALVIATPLSIAIALFLTEIAPKRLAAPIATMVELLAAIPSVVLGLWGILVFGPWVRDHLEPWIQATPLGALPIFSGDPSQAGILPAAPRPDDHDHPDYVRDLPRALPSRPQRPDGRRARARLDPLGVDPRGDAGLCRTRNHGGGAPGAWQGLR